MNIAQAHTVCGDYVWLLREVINVENSLRIPRKEIVDRVDYPKAQIVQSVVPLVTPCENAST